MRFIVGLVSVALALCLGASVAHAEKRVALVIGNSTYTNLPDDQQLKTASNDARAVATALSRLGFEVIEGENLSQAAFNARFDELTRKLSPGDTALVYFAGHGISLSGGNYLLPSDVPDVEGGQEGLLTRSSLGEEDMVAEMRARGVRVVVVLDACRANPFKRGNRALIGAERGLTRIEPLKPSNSVFKLYSAGIGQSALDQLNGNDNNPNSVFTRVFVSELAKPGIDLSTLGKEVAKEVQRLAATVGHDQQPASYDNMAGRVTLAAAPSGELTPVRPTEGTPTGSDAARDAWMVVRGTASIAVLEDFARHYGDSDYASLARARIEELRKAPVAVAVPSTAAADPNPVRSTDAVSSPSDAAERAWMVARGTSSIAVLEDFVSRHSDSSYASLARARIEELRKRPVAAAVPPATGPTAPSSGAIVTHGKQNHENVPKTEKLPDAIGGERLRTAALRGDPAAAYEVGLRFLEGRGVPVNYAEAAAWFKRAQEAGLLPAAFQLGVLYEKGQGVEKDVTAARMYYLKAAEGGNAAAMHNLAVLEAEGGNSASAAQWFIKAANRGVRDSQFRLAVLYYRGVGVKQDLAESYKWFCLAGANGDRDAKNRCNDLGRLPFNSNDLLGDVRRASAEQAIRSFVVEKQPEDAISVRAPVGGWDEEAENKPDRVDQDIHRVPFSSDFPVIVMRIRFGQPGVPESQKLPDAIGNENLRSSALRGDPAAVYEIGRRFSEGKVVPRDYPAAALWFRRAEQAGVVPAAFQLGVIYERGLGGEDDFDKARIYYKEAAEEGNAAAMHNLAVIDGNTGNSGSAAQWFLKAANRGVRDSQFNLAVLYYRGVGVKRDLAESYKWYSLAGAQGDSVAIVRRDELANRLSDEAKAAAEQAVRGFVVEKQPEEAFIVPVPVGGWDATDANGAKTPDPATPGAATAPTTAPQPEATATGTRVSRANVPATETLPDAIGPDDLRAAALRGEPAAAYEIGMRFSKGRGVPVDYRDAAIWFRRADQAGIVPAAFRLGVLYEKGQGVEKDADTAMMYYRRAAERGNAAATYNVALLEAARGNDTRAAEWFLKAANYGVADSQFNLAVLYYRGRGVEQDMAESYKWFSLSAAQGDRVAMDRRNDVAMRLNDAARASVDKAIRSFVVERQRDEAVSVPTPVGGWDAPGMETPDPAGSGPAAAPATKPQPETTAMDTGKSGANGPDAETLPDAIGGERLRAAAKRGDPAAAYEVGKRFSEGRGVPGNYRAAAVWFKRAEQAGLLPAAFELGVLYEKGQGVEKDSDKAKMYLLKAAEGGNAAAMHNLAVLEADRGNSVSAADWFLKAANRGLTDSQFNLAVLYYRGVGVERDMAESYKWFSLAAARGDRDAKDRRKDVAMRLSDAALATAEQAIRSFVVEAQPDEAVNVPAPFGGWDAPVEKTPEPAAPGAAPAPL